MSFRFRQRRCTPESSARAADHETRAGAKAASPVAVLLSANSLEFLPRDVAKSAGASERLPSMKQLAENLWVKHYPLALLGTDLGRTLTIIRMSSGRLVFHSMASFSATDLAEIRALGEPSWLVEAMLLHDTCARQGRDAFPNIPFLALEVFNQVVNFATQPLLPAPAE